MKLGEIRRNFLSKAGPHPSGWAAVWSAFISMLREPVDDKEVLADLAQLDIVPPQPPYVEHVRVGLSRVLAVTGSDPGVDMEAGLYVTASWRDAVDVGSEIIEAAGKRPSSYDQDPLPDVEHFARLVERLPAVQRLNAADAMFLTFEARYKRPSEPD